MYGVCYRYFVIFILCSRTTLEEYFYSNSTTPDGTKATLPIYFSREVCITVFTILILGTIVISLARSFLFFFICTRSSQWLHDTMFYSLTRSTMRFFSTSPVGVYELLQVYILLEVLCCYVKLFLA